MNRTTLHKNLLAGLEAIPLLDAHTHIDAAHLTARGLYDILLYHMVVSDLVSAGCPSKERLPEEPSAAEAERRIEEALLFLPHIQNTAMFWGVKKILADLYGWHEPIDLSNWRRLDGIIRERFEEPDWAVGILNKAEIKRTCTELWRRRDGGSDRLLQYALEWAFFSRAQWGINDIPIFELERAWNQPGPSAPLPVTLGASRPEFDRKIKTLTDVHDAVEHYTNAIPYLEIISTAQHISTDIHFQMISPAQMEAALARRDQATPAERDIYASYILEAFLNALEKRSESIVFQFSIGAEPLPFETGSKLRQDTIFEVAGFISRYPGVQFQAFISSEHANQAFCTLARELPNFSLAGYWWHNFFPGVMRKVIHDRLDMLAANKQVGFFSDAYCLDWAYAKAYLVRAQWAEVLAQKIEQGQYSYNDALSIAHQIFYETPQSLLRMVPRQGDETDGNN